MLGRRDNSYILQPIAQQIPRKAAIKRYKKNPGFYLLVLFSLSIEFLHLYIDYRSFELLDILTNGLSLLFGIFGIKAIFQAVFKKT